MSKYLEECDWCSKPATKRIEDVRGYETAVACDGCVKYGIRYVLPVGDPRCGDRHDDDGEGGVREPRGDSPDSPAPGKTGLPGGSGGPGAFAFAGDDPRDIWANITPVSAEEFARIPVVVFGPDGAAHVEPLREYYRKREAEVSS